jgi:glycosyltransferase involved in cell wall biosynthesis
MRATDHAPGAARSGAHWFVVPPLEGPITGGTLYNRQLLRELRAAGAQGGPLDVAQALVALAEGRPGYYWVDTLLLEHVPALCRAQQSGQKVGLFLHYLPSLFARGADLTPPDLSREEDAALRAVEAFLAPSDFMRGVVTRLVGASRPVLVVHPGRFASGPAAPRAPNAAMHAVVAANLVAGKGIAPFLRALASELGGVDDFRLSIVGSADIDREYAAKCHRLAAEHRGLASRVVFEGPLPPEVVVERMAESDLLVSASVMESYGMALAEARTLGLPILAHRGGNVAELTDVEAGSILTQDHGDLARSFIHLARSPEELLERRGRATAKALPARAWAEAAREFVASSRGL